MGAAFFKLIGGVKGAIIIALVVALGTWVAVKKHRMDKELETAIEERDKAVAAAAQTAAERDKAIEAARVNSETINRLNEEKALINQALNAYQQLQSQNRATASAREIIIQREAVVPANSAPAAPIIGTIISEIQADRVRRRGNQGAQQ